MAFIQPNGKLLEDENQDLIGAEQAPMVGESSQDVGAGASTAGIGPGGQGAWTNIQSYLQANKSDTGSAQALDKTVSDQFGKEQKQMQDESSKFLGDARSAVDSQKIDSNQANQLIKDSAQAYSYGGSQNQGYQDNVDKVRTALTSDYTGPKDYTYGISDESQRAGGALKGEGFDAYMNDVYSNSAGRPLNSGQYTLQKQLDVNNESLAKTRENLLKKYSDLEAGRDQIVGDTTKELGSLEKQHRTNQNSLLDYLRSEGNRYDTEITQTEADARSAYQNSYKNDRSGRSNTFYGQSVQVDPDFYSNRGVWGPNLTYEELQREQDLAHNGGMPTSRGSYYWLENIPNSLPVWGDLKNYLNTNSDTLNQFYGEQDARYANTADEQERSFNAIQDFLKSDTARKQQGFKVRG